VVRWDGRRIRGGLEESAEDSVRWPGKLGKGPPRLSSPSRLAPRAESLPVRLATVTSLSDRSLRLPLAVVRDQTARYPSWKNATITARMSAAGRLVPDPAYGPSNPSSLVTPWSRPAV